MHYGGIAFILVPPFCYMIHYVILYLLVCNRFILIHLPSTWEKTFLSLGGLSLQTSSRCRDQYRDHRTMQVGLTHHTKVWTQHQCLYDAFYMTWSTLCPDLQLRTIYKDKCAWYNTLEICITNLFIQTPRSCQTLIPFLDPWISISSAYDCLGAQT